MCSQLCKIFTFCNIQQKNNYSVIFGKILNTKGLDKIDLKDFEVNQKDPLAWKSVLFTFQTDNKTLKVDHLRAPDGYFKSNV